MKVLLISVQNDATVGGIAIWTKHFLSLCSQHSLQCTLINTEKATEQTFGGISEIHRTKRIFQDLNCTLKAESFDIAHLNTSCGPFGLFRDYLIAKKLKRKGIPVVTHYHCDIPKWINNPLRRAVVKKLARLSHKNLVLCESSHAYLEQFQIPSVKVPNFIQEDKIADKPKEIHEKFSRIFFVGRISIVKGAKEIFELAERFPEKTFALAGSVIPPVDTWEKPANLHLIGRITPARVMELLDEADLFLFPSHSEGFSLALMEAMARGVPCLAYASVGANSDMLADNCGVTVDKGDVDALAMALQNLEDSSARESISKNAITKVRQHYAANSVMNLFTSLYHDCL